MGVEAERIAAFDPRKQRASLCAKQSGSSVGAIRMQSQIFLLAQIRNVIQRVDRAGVGRTGIGNHAERQPSSRAILFNRSAERFRR